MHRIAMEDFDDTHDLGPLSALFSKTHLKIEKSISIV